MTDFKRTICLDFDGVLHGYSRGWDDGTIYDPPVLGAVESVKALAEKYRLVISTCREDTVAIWQWLNKFGMNEYIAEVTNGKPKAMLYIDDRAIRFRDWRTALAEVDQHG